MEGIKMETKHIGEIGVDSGTMMLIDPCYVLQRQSPEPKKWSQICDEITENWDKGDKGMLLKPDNDIHSPFNHGAVFETGFGDGCYPVSITIADLGKWGKRVVSAEITFVTKEDILRHASDDAANDDDVMEFGEDEFCHYGIHR